MFLNIYNSFFFYRVIQSVLSDLHVNSLWQLVLKSMKSTSTLRSVIPQNLFSSSKAIIFQYKSQTVQTKVSPLLWTGCRHNALDSSELNLWCLNCCISLWHTHAHIHIHAYRHTHKFICINIIKTRLSFANHDHLRTWCQLSLFYSCLLMCFKYCWKHFTD